MGIVLKDNKDGTTTWEAEAMNASAFPKPSLRPYLTSDLPLLSEIRFAAIEELTVDDYDEAQRRAWAASLPTMTRLWRKISKKA